MSDYTIDLFMWGYQQHVQIAFQVTAEGLFEKLDRKLKTNVFFVGVLIDDNRADRHTICLEPEDCGYKVHSFSDVKALAVELQKVDEEGRIFHTHEIAQENHNNRITSRSYVEAISKILKRDSIYGKQEHFVASPANIDGYLVFTVLALDKEAVDNHYSLTKNKWNERYTISRSLIESAINIFLSECFYALRSPNDTEGIRKRTDELLREASRQFMYTISKAGNNFEGLHGLYDACNEIASMKYEGAVGIGNIIVAPKEHKNVKFTLQVKNPIRIRDYRKVRKFLELSDNSSSIICDSANIYGLGELRGKYNPKDENLFVVNFSSHFKWVLMHDNNPLMEVEYRQPSLPVEKINREKFHSDIRRLFRGITKDQIDDLWEVAIEATKQKHGTMLVISDNADEEAERLGKQCFPLKPLKLVDSLVQQVTAIDGAVLLDRNATCHAIGVILDGLATEKGDSSRGARYNSAIRYYEQHGKSTSLVLVIVSEDGMINLIPELRPQIKRSQIENAIKDFENILKAEKLNHKTFNFGMSFFGSINFYLSEKECKQINKLRVDIETKFAKDLVMGRILYENLRPDPEMDDSYYM